MTLVNRDGVMALAVGFPAWLKKNKLPLGCVIFFIFAYVLLTHTGPETKPRPSSYKVANVRTILTKKESVKIPVYTRGIVYPRTKIKLAAEATGRILEISPKLANGNFFKKGDVLLRISDDQVLLDKKKAEAQVASAALALSQVRAQYRSSSSVKGLRKTDYAKGVPQMNDAKARLEAAKAVLKGTKYQLSKTVVKAPFHGRVNMVAIGFGELVTIGQPIAEIYAVDAAEIRLPLSDAQYRLIDVPTVYIDGSGSDISPLNDKQPNVLLRETQGQYFWSGHLERSEGSIDLRNRLRYVVARVDSPYAKDPRQPGRPPLDSGLFIEAMIEGKQVDDVVVLPRSALRKDDEVWVVSDDSKILIKDVSVLYRGKNKAYINAGLESDEHVVITPLNVVIEGMEVKIIHEPKILHGAKSQSGMSLGLATSAEEEVTP